MSKKNELKVKYYLTKGQKFERIYKDQPPFIIKYNLEPNQTNINLILLKRILSQEINIYNISEIRYKNKAKKGFVKITNRTSFPIDFKEILLKIQLKDSEPKILSQLESISKNLEIKLKQFEKFNSKIKDFLDKQKLDLYFLYAFSLEESQDYDSDSIIAYHLEIAKIIQLFENSKKNFNALFQSANIQRLKEAIREEPKIIHISCHGSVKTEFVSKKEGNYSEEVEESDDNSSDEPEKGIIYNLKFEDKGKNQNITIKELDNVLSSLEDNLKNIDLVFLSSCYSQYSGKLFHKHGVKNVIYIKKNCEVSNKVSLVFANSFYQKLIECYNIKKAFDSTIKEIYEQEKKKYKNRPKCCCKVHKQHIKTCCLYYKKDREKIHDKFAINTCTCDFDDFSIHNKGCYLVSLVKKWNKENEKKLICQNIKGETYKICCGCDEEDEDVHRFGESFKFILKSQNAQSQKKIIYGNKRVGILNRNENCIIVKDKEMFKDIVLMQIERRYNVQDIYDIIDNKYSEINYIIIYGDIGVGKMNFANSVCAYLFERNAINKFYIIRARTIDTIKKEIENKTNKKPEEKNKEYKYVFIIDVDYDLETPINLVNEIINEDSISNPSFYFFILLRTKKDKIENEIEQNKKKSKLIHLENLSDDKALQLMKELKDTYDFEKFLTKEQKMKLIQLFGNSRKEMFPLMKLIEQNDKFEELVKKVKEIRNSKKNIKNMVSRLTEKEPEKIFLLYIMDKGLPPSVLKLFEPNFTKILEQEELSIFFYKTKNMTWRLSKSIINIDDIIPHLISDKRKKTVEKCLEIFSKLLFYYNKKFGRILKQNYFKALDIEYYFDLFFENVEFFKTFNKEKYNLCFSKELNPNFNDYENIIKNNNIKLDEQKENIYNLFELNKETISKLYSENETMKEYIEQIIILLPRLFIKNKFETKIVLDILDRLIIILKNFENIDKRNILRIKLLYLFYQEKNEINNYNFNDLDKEGKAYENFINGLRMEHNLSSQELNNKEKKGRINYKIEKAKNFYKEASELFINKTMKAYCYYQLGNIEYEQKQYEEAEKMYNKGKSLPGIDNYVKGFLNIKLAKLIIDNIHNEINNKEKFDEIIEDIIDLNDIWFINEALELQNEIEEKLSPDIVLLNSNPIIKEENNYSNNKIMAAPNNQYYLMNKIFNRNDINTNLIIKYKVLNEDNLREAFSGKGKVLIIQSDNFNDNGDLFLEDNLGKSYLLSKDYFLKRKKINYDVLILCYINSGKLIIKEPDKKENFENRVKYLITFDSNCSDIFNDIGIESYLEYNKRSIEFLEHFIVNITKQDVKTAFEKACGTFERSFKNFCRHKTGSNKYDKINYITLTLNNQGRIKKNECILSESGNKNIQFTPYPLLSGVNLKFSYVSDYSDKIAYIIKKIMNSYEIFYYYDVTDKKKKKIEINVFEKKETDININNNLCLKANKLIAFEIMRFLFRHHEHFNPSWFRYFLNLDEYMKDLDNLYLKRKEYSSGLGLIIINITESIENKNIIKIPDFIYIYLSNFSMPGPVINIDISKPTNDNELNVSNEESSINNIKIKKVYSSYQVNKIQNLDIYSNISKSNKELTKIKKNSNSQTTINKKKIKSYEDEALGLTKYDYEEGEDMDDDYLDKDD